MKAFTSLALFGSIVKLSGAFIKCVSRDGKFGLMPDAFSTASGNLAGWAVAKVTMGEEVLVFWATA